MPAGVQSIVLAALDLTPKTQDQAPDVFTRWAWSILIMTVTAGFMIRVYKSPTYSADPPCEEYKLLCSNHL